MTMITQLKTKSISAKQIFDSLTYRQRAIIDIVEFFRKKGICKASQETIGEMLGCSRRTINGEISLLKKIGLLEVQHRFNNSNFTSTSHWFRRPEVQNLLPYYFYNFTVTILSLSMLSSSLLTSSDVLRFKNPSFPSPSYEGVNMGIEGRTDRKETKKEEDPKKDNQVSVPEAGHIKKICQSLQRRGSTLTNDDALKLLAYQPDVHERASDRFKKEAKGKIKDPLAFYLYLCRDIATKEGRTGNWNRVEQLKSEGYVLLEETLLRPEGSGGHALQGTKNSGTQKGTNDNPSYSEQVQQERKKMDEEAAARKTKTGPLAEEVLKWNETVYELEKRVKAGDMAAQWTLPLAIGTLKHLISEYQVDPGNEKAMEYARAFTASQKTEAVNQVGKIPEIPTSTASSPLASSGCADFKTPASCLSSLLRPEGSGGQALLPSAPVVKKSEPVTLKEDIWEGFKDYDSDEPKEEFNEEIYD